MNLSFGTPGILLSMPETSFRRLAMADLDEVALRRLIDEGETLFVERKQATPREGLGPTVASFANTLGGWLLLGIADDKTIHGYMARGDFVDHLRQTLRAELDPLPPFAAERVEIDGKEIGVVRVFESADTPHIVIGTGSVYVREPGGKRSIESHGELVQLARRGEKAREKAADRLRTLPFALEQLNAPELLPGFSGSYDSPTHRQLILRAAPLTIPGTFADQVLSSKTGAAASELAKEVFPGGPADPTHRWIDWAYGQRGFGATAGQLGSDERSSVIADAGGVLILRIEWSKKGRQPHLRPECLTQTLEPLLHGLAQLLAQLDAHGRIVVELVMRGFRDVYVIGDRTGSGQLPKDSFFVGAELTSPPDQDEIAELTDHLIKEIERAAGLAAWQT